MSDRHAPATRLLDRHFRWRGVGVSRLEGFADAVFAIVLALLFLRAAPPETFGDLKAAMRGLVPFAASFAIIAYVWVEHWLFSRRYGLQDGWTILLNLVLLFLLLFYAYPLKFLMTLLSVALFGPIGALDLERISLGHAGIGDTADLFVFYGVGYGSIFVVIALLYLRALQLRGHLALDRIERFLTRSAVLQCLLQAAVAGASILMAVAGVGFGVGLPGWIFCLIGPLMAAHGMWQGRRLDALRRQA